MAAANENLSPKAVRELARELKGLTESPPEGIRIIISEDNLANIQAEIDGPGKAGNFSGFKGAALVSVGTPYEGGVFRMKLVLGQDYPQAPPKGFFITRIFHPNIAKNGEICVNTLKKDWKATLGVRHVLVVIRCLLIEPFPESALNEDAGKMLMEDYEGYARHARLMTSIHASKASRPKMSTKASFDPSGLSVAASENAVQPHTPLTVNMANTDALTTEALALAGNMPMDFTAVTSSPTAKKPKGEVGTKPSADRRKPDNRKKSLKRL